MQLQRHIGGELRNAQMTDSLIYSDEQSPNIKESSVGNLLNSFIVLTPPASPDNISVQRCAEKTPPETSLDDVLRAAEHLSNKFEALLKRCDKIKRNVLSSYAEFIQSDFAFQSSIYRGGESCALPPKEHNTSVTSVSSSVLRACLSQIEHCYDSDATLSSSGDESPEDVPNVNCVRNSFYKAWVSRQIKRTQLEASRYSSMLELVRKTKENTEKYRFANGVKQQLSLSKLNASSRNVCELISRPLNRRKRRNISSEEESKINQLTRKKMRHGGPSCFDLDNIVSLDRVVSLSGPAKFARNNIDIKIPLWRIKNLSALEELSDDAEDLNESAYSKRHEPCELEEKDKVFYLKMLKQQFNIKSASNANLTMHDVEQDPEFQLLVRNKVSQNLNTNVTLEPTSSQRNYGYMKRSFPLDGKSSSSDSLS